MAATTDITMESSQEESPSSTDTVEVNKWTVHSEIIAQLNEYFTEKTSFPVEVRLKPRASTRFETIRSLVHTYLISFERIGLPSTLDGWQDTPELASSVERIVASESSCPHTTLSLGEMAIQIHVYQPSDTDSFEEFSNSSGVRADDDDTMAASVCELPNRSWEGLWDSLIYSDDIKMKLLDYIHATLVFSDANVDCGFPLFPIARTLTL